MSGHTLRSNATYRGLRKHGTALVVVDPAFAPDLAGALVLVTTGDYLGGSQVRCCPFWVLARIVRVNGGAARLERVPFPNLPATVRDAKHGEWTIERRMGRSRVLLSGSVCKGGRWVPSARIVGLDEFHAEYHVASQDEPWNLVGANAGEEG